MLLPPNFISKLIIMGFHASGIVLASFLLFKLFRYESNFRIKNPLMLVKQLANESFLWILWNLVVMTMFWIQVDGMPISPAGFILWPSFLMWTNMRIYSKYRALTS